MAFLITALTVAIISLYALSIKEAIVYGFITLLFATFGKTILMLPLLSLLPHKARMKHMEMVEKGGYIFAYIIFITGSFLVNNFLAIPSSIACLVDYYWKRESDKVLFKK